MIPIEPLDAGMFYVETEEMTQHMMGVLLIDPPDDGTPAMALVRGAIETRLHLIPPFRRRLLEAPLKIGDPYWLEDPDFDIDRHVSHHVLPAPGSRLDLDALVGELAAGCLDRSKPLWELAVIEGLEQVHPGVKERLLKGDKLNPTLHAHIDGRLALLGLAEPVDQDAEVRIIPAIAGW